MNGTIKRVMHDKGFGFIRSSDGDEFFFHRSGMAARGTSFESLSEGARVEFEEEEGPKGPRATNVRIIG